MRKNNITLIVATANASQWSEEESCKSTLNTCGDGRRRGHSSALTACVIVVWRNARLKRLQRRQMVWCNVLRSVECPLHCSDGCLLAQAVKVSMPINKTEFRKEEAACIITERLHEMTCATAWLDASHACESHGSVCVASLQR